MKINDKSVRGLIARLADVIRAENITASNYLDLYAGDEALECIDNVNNQAIYGRRGSGKTHLLKALQEKINADFENGRRLCVYIDARNILPLINSSVATSEESALLIFQGIVQSMIDAFSINVRLIFGRDQIIPLNADPLDSDAVRRIEDQLRKINLEFSGRSLRRLGSIAITEERNSGSEFQLEVAANPKISAGGKSSGKQTEVKADIRYVSIQEISSSLQALIEWLDLSRAICLIDEWSEIPSDVQKHLAELIKRVFISSKFSFKIGAIPNRTDLGHRTPGKFYGLEDGGDIFGYQLDNRYVFEIEKNKTRDFFNDLLHRHLYAIDPVVVEGILKTNNKTESTFINAFLTNKALGELCIASAGIPRDFINLFIHSYDQFKSSSLRHISVKNVRMATSGWYETDKKKQIDEHMSDKVLLQAIVEEIVMKKKSSHFMLSEKHSSNPHILSLIDFRVLHLRKKGYSHQDIPGESFNVYFIDYGCYNHLNITRANLNHASLDNISVQDDMRQIRRIVISDSFLQKFQMHIGEAFSCPVCKKPVDTMHPAYVKQQLCNNCFEPAGLSGQSRSTV
ncbi:hypothetical protein [Paucibacter sp. Y2R2-4]|uniref:ORC-CDC6 family AAA ATPase n=1 Tax=Paucibacter sp. Y2R2-4 TaxID=2893553 RepID=UPI0021E3C789|nr:hypothetical protein [Paucibacter sp. Y2R2-4]MCV2351991.1 hypothetical protein [Paucibacter sp. Y2R2-4]